jgi:hypothetical protein
VIVLALMRQQTSLNFLSVRWVVRQVIFGVNVQEVCSRNSMSQQSTAIDAGWLT